MNHVITLESLESIFLHKLYLIYIYLDAKLVSLILDKIYTYNIDNLLDSNIQGMSYSIF